MRWWSVVLAVALGCKQGLPSPAEIADQGWAAHELVVAAGEAQPTCAGAGAAMQRVFAEHRQAFVDAMALDRDKARLEAATTYLEAHADRYADLETRMEALQIAARPNRPCRRPSRRWRTRSRVRQMSTDDEDFAAMLAESEAEHPAPSARRSEIRSRAR